MTHKRILIAALAVLVSSGALGVPPNRGWIKVELASAEANPKPIPAGLAKPFGGDDIADYGSYRIVALPENALGALQAASDRIGVRVRRRDELDRINTPGLSVDTRFGLDPGISPAQLVHEYPQGKNGLYIAQLIGPPKSEWLIALRNAGWILARYVPNDAYVLVGTPSLVPKTRQLPFIQFFDFYHPVEKDVLLSTAAEDDEFVVNLPTVADRDEAIEAVRSAAAAGSLRIDTYEHDTQLRARLSRPNALGLLQHRLIISIESAPPGHPSDERQAMSITSNLDPGPPLRPTNARGYAAWITDHCSTCSAANMPSGTWRVGLADTGLDGGTFGGHHLDLNGREFWGGMFNPLDPVTHLPTPENCANGRNDCDIHMHGTMVAGILVGNAGTGLPAGTDYWYGSGIAPNAGVFSTKIFAYVNNQPTQAPDDIFAWSQDARNATPTVTIQNHSWNRYLGLGSYSTLSRDFDIAARDVDHNLANGLTSILFTVSSGNRHEPADNISTPVWPPGTAKNVITMGGLENYRPDQDFRVCDHGTQADDFRNLMSETRHGTSIPNYYKPDLVAPGSMIVSAKSQFNPGVQQPPFCSTNFDGANNYMIESGTSFAAPVAAGASLLVKRYLGTGPATTSPALAKAALIAGARSVQGGLDRTSTQSPTPTIGPIPNTQQGFGRISLESILTGTTPPVFFDESVNGSFSTTGQRWTTRLRVRDQTKPVVIALVWTDAPGNENGGCAANCDSALINDLDLRVDPIKTDCTYFQGNSLGSNEMSNSYQCTANASRDEWNPVEYARFLVDGYTRFNVTVAAHDYRDPDLVAQPFALVVLNADLDAGSNALAPQLSATADANTPANIHLSWSPAFNVVVTGYDVRRGSFRGPTSNDLAVVQGLHTSADITANDDPGRPSGVHTWLYQVRALGPSLPNGLDSNLDYATTSSFNATDDTLDIVRAVHFTKLMEAVNAVRAATVGLSAASFTAPPPDALPLPHPTVTKEHLKNLRDALDAARDANHLDLAAIQYEDPTSQITPGQTNIKRKHIEELRTGVQ